MTPRDVWVVVDRADNPVCVERTEGRARRETAGEHVHKYILATTLDAEREQAKHLEDDRDKYEVKARAYGTMVFIYREALEAIAAPKSTGDTAIDTARNALARRHAGFGHGLTDRDLAAFDALCVAERERIRVEERERIRGEVTSECITTLWKLGHTDAATALRESLADEAIRARGKDAGRSVLAIAPAPDAADEETYPCRHPGCDVRRTKAEGGTTFTVCDEHWTKPALAAAQAQCRLLETDLALGRARADAARAHASRWKRLAKSLRGGRDAARHALYIYAKSFVGSRVALERADALALWFSNESDPWPEGIAAYRAARGKP